MTRLNDPSIALKNQNTCPFKGKCTYARKQEPDQGVVKDCK